MWVSNEGCERLGKENFVLLLQDLGEDAPLHVGGLRLDCNGDSLQEITGTGRRQASCSSFLLTLLHFNP